MTSFILPYVIVSWSQRQHPTFLLQIERATLFNDIEKINERIISDNTSILDQIMLNGNENYNHDSNQKILISTINICIDSKRFDIPML